ncbi:hypothetical protein AVEN_203182-1 [Araneus ventricosus]|uniref:Uncharacterized protein n=1 Tax=Araneus ventricosus TaxID=182803 RepID=A0A4Y2CGR1_ARAVE|nr:hypothetical protein AVEN_203182-1 [Araneus ventricosus]
MKTHEQVRIFPNFVTIPAESHLIPTDLTSTLPIHGDTGRKICNNMPSISLRPTNWIREDVIFFSQHGPFPAYLKRFHLSDSDYCNCGGIGTALHYATECIYTVSWHMRRPAPNFEQEWLKRVAKNLVSRQKIHEIIKFISENRHLFRPP